MLGKNHTDEGSRAGKLTKRRKTNLILNSLIAMVLLLIIVVSVNIFFGDSQSGQPPEDTAPAQEETDAAGNEQEAGSGDTGAANDEEEATDENDESSPEEDEEQNEDQDTAEANDDEGERVVTEGGSSPDVKRTIVDPNWKPVGTSQSGEHVAVYDKNHVDWQEMLQAISYATGIDQGNMTVWFLGNNGGPNSAAGTVSNKGGNEKYRVAIEWVDNEGWKPVKVEELSQ